MRYLIVGCGRVGSTLAKLLVAESMTSSSWTRTRPHSNGSGNRFGGHVEVGTGIDYDVLKRAGAERTDGFVAVTDGDNRNVMSAFDRAAHVPHPEDRRAHLRSAARPALSRSRHRDVLPDDDRRTDHSRPLHDVPYTSMPSFDFGRLTSLVATVSKAQAGQRVSDIEQDGKIRIAAIRRLGSVSIAAPGDMLMEGDEINAIVAPEALSRHSPLRSVRRGRKRA